MLFRYLCSATLNRTDSLPTQNCSPMQLFYLGMEADLGGTMAIFSEFNRGLDFPNTSNPHVGVAIKLIACGAHSSKDASFLKERPLLNFSSPEICSAKTRAVTLSGLKARVNLDFMHATDRRSEMDTSCFFPLISGAQESCPSPKNVPWQCLP